MTNQTIASMMENVTWLVLHHFMTIIKTTGSKSIKWKAFCYSITYVSVSLKYSFSLQSVVIHLHMDVARHN